MQTTNGGDPAALRRSSMSTSAATLFVEEEQSLDTEVVHGNETVGFIAIDVGILKTDANSPQEIGEARVVLADSNWTTVTFRRAYENPVVVFGSMTTTGNQAATIRIRNLNSTGFEVKIREWDYLDGSHGLEEIGFTVVEAGSHILADGTRIEAGTTTSYNAFRRIIFNETFQDTPIVMTQVLSENGYFRGNNSNGAILRHHTLTSKFRKKRPTTIFMLPNPSAGSRSNNESAADMRLGRRPIP